MILSQYLECQQPLSGQPLQNQPLQNRLLARRIITDLAVMVAVHEVDCQPNTQPNDESHPVFRWE